MKNLTPGSAGRGAFNETVWSRSARADDGDVILAFAALATARTTVWDGAGDIVAIGLVVRRGLGEFADLAVGTGRRCAAFGARSEATIDAVTVGIAGYDEHSPFGLRGID